MAYPLHADRNSSRSVHKSIIHPIAEQPDEELSATENAPLLDLISELESLTADLTTYEKGVLRVTTNSDALKLDQPLGLAQPRSEGSQPSLYDNEAGLGGVKKSEEIGRSPTTDSDSAFVREFDSLTADNSRYSLDINSDENKSDSSSEDDAIEMDNFCGDDALSTNVIYISPCYEAPREPNKGASYSRQESASETCYDNVDVTHKVVGGISLFLIEFYTHSLTTLSILMLAITHQAA